MKRFLTLWAITTLWLLGGVCHAEPITLLLVGLGVSAATAATITAGIVTAITGAVISYGLSAIAGVISKKKTPGSAAFASFAENRIQMVQSSIESFKVVYGRARVSGPIVLASTTDTSSYRNRVLHLLVVVAGHEVEEIESVYLDEDLVVLDGNDLATNSKFLGTGTDGFVKGAKLVKVKKYTGSPDQLASIDLLEDIPGWTNNHRLRGLAYVYVRISHSVDRFSSGIPNISAIVKGKKVYDPRNGLTAYSNNLALCVRDYLASNEYGIGATEEEIDDDSIIAAANICDEDVTLKDGTTQDRYTCNGVVDTEGVPADIIQDFAVSGAGAVTYNQGQFRVHVGAYDTPTVAVDESWLAGDIEVIARPERDEVFNAVKGVFVDPAKGYQPTDFPIVTNATYEAQDGNEQIVRDVELPFVTDVERAQRAAKIVLEKGRQGIIATLPCNYKALQLTTWDTISLTIDLLGWSSKVFRVINWELGQEGEILISIQEESSGAYDWNAGEATVVDDAPDTTLPDLSDIEVPGNPVVVESLYSTTDGSGLKTKAAVTWAESEYGFTTQYELSYKLAADTEYTPVGRFRSTFGEIYDLEPGFYDFKVVAINALGNTSEGAVTQKEIIGLTALPADITGFSMNAVNDQAHLSWVQATDLDVKLGGSIRLKWSSLTTGADWTNSVQLVEDFSGITTTAVVPLLDGTYLIKAVDSGGRESENAASIVSTAAYLFTRNSVLISTQSPTFTGTKTNMVVDVSNLKLESTTLWDDVSPSVDIDDWSGDIDNPDSTGLASTGEYLFYNATSSATYYDLGDVYTSRVTVDITSQVYDTGITWDSLNTGIDIDSWTGLIDGEELSGTTVTFQIRTTDDDPSGTPTWSSWRQFVVGDYTARAYQVKLMVANTVPSNNINIQTLGVTIDMPDRLERFEDRAILSGGNAITYAKPFYGRPDVAVTIQGAISGDTSKVTHILTGALYTGVTVQILNGGSGVARTCDVYIKGF